MTVPASPSEIAEFIARAEAQMARQDAEMERQASEQAMFQQRLDLFNTLAAQRMSLLICAAFNPNLTAKDLEALCQQ